MMQLFLSVLIILFKYGSTSDAMVITDAYYRLPPLFHLDDYQRCLSQPGGLYCLGTFHIQPAVEPHPDYEFIKDYSELPFKFNRTLIHRGWCVSARCKRPQVNASLTEADGASLQFERCAAQWGRARGLTTSLHTLRYCRSHQDTLIEEPTTPEQRTFIEVIYVILLLNVIGTAYDVMTDNDRKTIKLLTAWSIPANWRRLTVAYESQDLSLSVLQGAKVICLLLIMYGHASILVYRYFTRNPEFLEAKSNRLDGILVSSGTSLVHTFIMISTFLTTYNLLLYSDRKPLSLNMLPSCILKRLFRLAPVNLLVVGYAATWWPYARQGPLVAPVIGDESRQCRDKYWAQALFINNIVDPGENCLAPTWFLAADFQLYIMTCVLTLSAGWLKRNALVVYPMLVVASSILNGLVTYIFGYRAMIYISTPENLGRMFRGVRSFSNFYNSTWGAMPACFIGMFLAHLHYRLQKKSLKEEDHKWLKMYQYVCIPVAIGWVLAGYYVLGYESPIIMAAYICVDRTTLVSILALGIFVTIYTNGDFRRFFAWSGWNIFARLSLPVMLLHWCVNMAIAARPYAYHTSLFDIAVDWLATGCITYAIAVPIAVLVEIPIQKFFSTLMY